MQPIHLDTRPTSLVILTATATHRKLTAILISCSYSQQRRDKGPKERQRGTRRTSKEETANGGWRGGERDGIVANNFTELGGGINASQMVAALTAESIEALFLLTK